MRLNRPEEAVGALEKAARLNPRDTNASCYLAVAEGVRGNLQKSLEILRRAVISNPDHALCWINLGITHEAIGDLKPALLDYDEAIRLQPDSSDARHRRNGIIERLRP